MQNDLGPPETVQIPIFSIWHTVPQQQLSVSLPIEIKRGITIEDIGLFAFYVASVLSIFYILSGPSTVHAPILLQFALWAFFLILTKHVFVLVSYYCVKLELFK